VRAKGVSENFCTVVKEACEELGLEDIKFEDRAPRKKEQMKQMMEVEFLHAIQAIIPPILLGSGRVKAMEEAKISLRRWKRMQRRISRRGKWRKFLLSQY
jgi:hypothetical protein